MAGRGTRRNETAAADVRERPVRLPRWCAPAKQDLRRSRQEVLNNDITARTRKRSRRLVAVGRETDVTRFDVYRYVNGKGRKRFNRDGRERDGVKTAPGPSSCREGERPRYPVPVELSAKNVRRRRGSRASDAPF